MGEERDWVGRDPGVGRRDPMGVGCEKTEEGRAGGWEGTEEGRS